MAEPFDIRISAIDDTLSGTLERAADGLIHCRSDITTRPQRAGTEQGEGAPALFKHLACPGFIVPSMICDFLSCNTATRAFFETLTGLLAQIGGETSHKRRTGSELCNRRLQQVLDG